MILGIVSGSLISWGIFPWWSFALFGVMELSWAVTSSFILEMSWLFSFFRWRVRHKLLHLRRCSDPSFSFSGIRLDDIGFIGQKSLDDSRNQISFRVCREASSQLPSSRRCSERSLEGSITNSFISKMIQIFFGPGGLARIFVFTLTTIERSLLQDVWLQLRWLRRYGFGRFFFTAQDISTVLLPKEWPLRMCHS